MADLGFKDAAEGAWIKLQAALPSELRQQAEFVRQRILIDARGWRDSAEAISALPVLLEALWRGRQLRFMYEKSGGAATERVVDPLGLVARGSTWYLVADKGDQRRTYRVSRIRDAAVHDLPGRRPADFDLAGHWERAAAEFRDKLPRYYATFVAEPSVMPWVRYRGSRVEVETSTGERFRIRVRFDVAEEALQFALAFGPAIQVVEPLELRDRVVAAATAVVRAAQSVGPS